MNSASWRGGGAYGQVDGPFLGFQTLGFVQCPFDACTFCLVSPGPNGQPVAHGVVGIHVDDGIGGGDERFFEAVHK